MTDVVMPGMNGRELAKILKAKFPGIKVIFMSCYTGDMIAKQEKIEAGKTFLQKPISPMRLSLKVRQILDSKHLRIIFTL